ncbi:MAG: hypothetical protein JXR56_06210 [Candidatus Cloacimonetes bacterium]|nr:hypothetical protein [Candidatus Cloacimonadota bacterium]
MSCKLWIIILVLLASTLCLGAQNSYRSENLIPEVSFKINPDSLTFIKDKGYLYEEKTKYYFKLLGLESMFPENSMFWTYYDESYYLVNRYYINDLYRTKLPFNGVLQVNLSTYMRNSHFMTFSIPFDFTSKKLYQDSFMQILHIFTPRYKDFNPEKEKKNEQF